MRRLLESAIELARGGVELTLAEAYLHAILDLISTTAAEGRGSAREVRTKASSERREEVQPPSVDTVRGLSGSSS